MSLPSKKSKPRSLPETSFSAQLRTIIRNRPGSAYSLARGANVDAAALGRFLSGERGLTSPSIDRLFAALNLKLVEGRRSNFKRAESGGDGLEDLDPGRLDVESPGPRLLESA